MKRLLLLFFLISPLTSPAQYTFDGYVDVGHTNVSYGAYGKVALISSYQYKFPDCKNRPGMDLSGA
jgi:hypothetical protein